MLYYYEEVEAEHNHVLHEAKQYLLPPARKCEGLPSHLQDNQQEIGGSFPNLSSVPSPPRYLPQLAPITTTQDSTTVY